MKRPVRSLLLGIATLLGSLAFAQPTPPYPVTISGQVLPCNPANGYVSISTAQNTQPVIDLDVPLDVNCSYSVTLMLDDPQGWIQVGVPCSGVMQYAIWTYQVSSLDTTVVVATVSCGPDICQAAFGVEQAMGGGALIPWQITTTNLSTGPAPIFYEWSMPDGSTSTSAQPSFTFTQPGVYGICLTISAGTCTSQFCDTVTVDSLGHIYTQPIWFDCLGVMWGNSLPGTSCDDGDPATTNDTWDANCTCTGTICVPPAITAPAGALTICSSDSLVLQAITTGTGPITYSWTGPGTFNDTTQMIFIYDAEPGTYQVTVANVCGTAVSDVQVTLTTAPNAGISADTSLCAATAPVSLLSLLGGTPDVGGVWSVNGATHSMFYDPAVDSPGVYGYTVAGDAPCPNASATVTITGSITWYGDADGDGFGDPNVTSQSCTQPAGYVGNANDLCPFIFGTVGSACDDGNPLTTNDQLNAICTCVGGFVDCLGIPGGPNVVGSLCTDSISGLIYLGNWDANCICQPGTFLDCLGIPGGTNVPGTPCSDPAISNGMWSADCICVVDTSSTSCQANFWVIQAYDSTATGVEPIPNEVWVWNLSSGGNGTYQFLWNFGDGSSSTDAYPTHVYTSNGPWTLCLTIASGSCTDVYCDSVSVDANGILNQLVIGGGHGTVGEASGSGARSEGFTLNVIQQIPAGISETPAFADLKAWPNPVLNELNLTFNTSESGTVPVTVIDPSGRTVIDGTQRLAAGSNTLRIPTSNLEPGLYMVRIGNDARSITQRFLKVR